jgi:alpha-glucan,water dikinase
MGEVLVGNYPGRPLAFERESGAAGVALLAMPSKRQALLPPASGTGGGALLIARSDSNGEDLEEYAGAGLYSSVPLVALEEVAVRYADEPLVWDAEFRAQLLEQVAALGMAVEGAFGSPQDVEGAVDGEGRLFVVQSRPQVF